MIITSAHNPLIKRIRQLQQRKQRQTQAAFFVEGIRNFLAAVENHALLDTILYSPDLLRSEPCYTAITQCQTAGIPTYTCSPDLFRKLTNRDHPAGIGAIVQEKTTTLEQLQVTDTSILVALDQVADPGNVGTILRTLDAVAGTALILLGTTTDPFHPTAIKASMGALFTVPICQVEQMETLWHWADTHTIQTIATSAKASQSYWQVSSSWVNTPLLFLMGSERQGLPANILAQAQQTVTIPMQGSVTSLNLAIATSLLLYEVQRQRRRIPTK